MKKKNIILIIICCLIMFTSLNVYAATSCDSCSGTFDPKFLEDMDTYVYTPIKWATPVILLLLTSVDFAKVVFSGDQKGMDKAKSNFLKRSVAALIIFFAPIIIKILSDFIQERSIYSCLETCFK